MTARCAQYMSALKLYVSAKAADDCARICTIYTVEIHILLLTHPIQP